MGQILALSSPVLIYVNDHTFLLTELITILFADDS